MQSQATSQIAYSQSERCDGKLQGSNHDTYISIKVDVSIFPASAFVISSHYEDLVRANHVFHPDEVGWWSYSKFLNQVWIANHSILESFELLRSTSCLYPEDYHINEVMLWPCYLIKETSLL